MPRLVEIGLLQQLEAFSRLGTLSAAAEELHITQPALTRSMKKLEDRLGVTLFVRGRNRLELNDNGRLAARLAAQAVAADEQLVREVRAADLRRRTISVGCCAPVPLQEVTLALQRLFQDKTVAASIVADPRLLPGLQEGTLQLAVTHVRPQEPGLWAEPCGEETLFIAVPPDHPLAGRVSVRFSDLEDVPFLQYSEVGFWSELVRSRIPRPHLLLQQNREDFTEIAAATDLPTFFTDYFFSRGDRIARGRRIIPIDDPEARAVYYLVCRETDLPKFRPLFARLPLFGRALRPGPDAKPALSGA